MISQKLKLEKSNLPLYAQLEQILKSQIITGELAVGKRIPTEKEFAALYQVSIITVRQAIMNLVQEGLLLRKQGIGTFVNEKFTNKHSNIMTINVGGEIDDVVPIGIKEQQVNVLDITRIKGLNLASAVLNIPAQHEAVLIRRTRESEGVLFSYIKNYMPIEIGNRITKEDLIHLPMLHILKNKLGIQLKRGIQFITAIVADYEVASALSISVTSPILYLETIIFDNKDKPMELVQTFYRSAQSKYTLQFELYDKAKNEELSDKYSNDSGLLYTTESGTPFRIHD